MLLSFRFLLFASLPLFCLLSRTQPSCPVPYHAISTTFASTFSLAFDAPFPCVLAADDDGMVHGGVTMD